MIFTFDVDNFPLYKERKTGHDSELFLKCHRASDFGRNFISPQENYDKRILFQAIKGFRLRIY